MNANFDDVQKALVVLFVIMSQESWPNRMIEGVDAMGVGVAPVQNAHPMIAYYYCAFLLVSNFVLLDVFTAVIFEKFNEAKRNESSLTALLLSNDQLA